MTRTALLRVYVPAEQASDEWLLLPEATHALDPVWRVGEFGILTESLQEDVVVAEYDGRRYVCPRQPRLRMLEGVVAFRRGLADLGVDAIISEAAANRAADELDHMRARDDMARSHILVSPFHVPLRWFLIFDPTDRILEVDENGVRLRYRTLRKETTRRLRRVIKVLRMGGLESLTEDMEQLLDWLLEFPGDHLVELDYDTVAGLFDGDELADDHSCEEMWSALEAVESEDLEAAGRWYGMVAGRWAEPMLLTHAN